jgi:uncharacterized repeat protein (TIGR01451 family)
MKSLRIICTAGAVATGLAWGQPVWATGTPAGTLIQNTATVTFNTGAGPITLQSTTNTIKVDQLIGVAVTALTSSPVSVGSANAVLPYQVTNTGNGADSFALTGAPAVAGNTFTTTLQTLAIDSNGNGVYDAGVDTVLTNGGASQMVAPDGTFRVFLVVSAPAGASDAQTSQVRLTATSLTGSGAPGTLFAGKGVGGVNAVVGLSGGTGNALDALVASLASVTLTKSALIVDPYGGANPVAGAVVTYSIVAHTTGSGIASGLTVTDAFPAGTTYQAGSITLNGAGQTDAADGDAGSASATGIAVVLGNVAGGSADRTVTFQVKIN